MTEVKFRGDWPEDIQSIVEPIVRKWAHIVPGWCRTIDVRFETRSGEEVSADVRVNYENRWAVISVCPQWLEDTPIDRERIIIHELAHIIVQPMKTVFMDSIAGLDGAFKDFAWAQFKQAWEGTVEDLAWAFYPRERGGE